MSDRSNEESAIAHLSAPLLFSLLKSASPAEINYWDRQAEELKLQEAAGKPNAKSNSAKARARADE